MRVTGSYADDAEILPFRLIADFNGYYGRDDQTYGGYYPDGIPPAEINPHFQIHISETGIIEIHFEHMFPDYDTTLWTEPDIGILGTGIWWDYDSDVFSGQFNPIDNDSSFIYDADVPFSSTYDDDEWAATNNAGWRIQPNATFDPDDDSTWFPDRWTSIDYAPVTTGRWTNIPLPGPLPIGQPREVTAGPAYPIRLPRAVDLGGQGKTSEWWLGHDGSVMAFHIDDPVLNPDLEPVTAGEDGVPSDAGTWTGFGVTGLFDTLIFLGFDSVGGLLHMSDLPTDEQARVPRHPVRYQIISEE